MQESVFKRELNKCRVVRREDHHKVRWKKLKESLSDIANKESKAAKKNKKNIKTNVKTVMNTNTPFWKDLQEMANNILTPDQCNRFMSQIKIEYPNVIDKVNLSDLETSVS